MRGTRSLEGGRRKKRRESKKTMLVEVPLTWGVSVTQAYGRSSFLLEENSVDIDEGFADVRSGRVT